MNFSITGSLLTTLRLSLYTLRLKKVPTFKLCENFALLESVRNLLQNLYDITHLTVGMLIHYLRKLKIQIFCRYSADMEENANNLHFKRTDFNSSMRITVYAECISVLTEYL